MRGVFISYRRQDSAPYAGRICDRLEAAFGRDRVFMDVEDIAPGVDFAEALEKTIRSCDVLVAVIGPRWLELLHAREGGRDYLEHEIAVALRLGVTIIPALAGGAAMPSESDLPPELAPLARRQAVTIRDAGFEQDAAELIYGIRKATGRARLGNPAIWIAGAVAIIMLACWALFWKGTGENDDLNGIWVARMQRSGGTPYNIRLRLELSGRTLNGTAEYPTGTGVIQEGTFARGRLAFSTKHIPQFETEPATVIFRGERRGSELELTTTTSDGGVAKGAARKIK